jgi:hypothetical protein
MVGNVQLIIIYTYSVIYIMQEKSKTVKVDCEKLIRGTGPRN